MKAIYIATEDVLSEAVADRLVLEVNQGLRVAVRMGRKGNSYLKQKLPELDRTARKIPVFLLTDLDRNECPPALRTNWYGNRELPEDLLLRIAVHEIEAWLLADRKGFSRFSGVPTEKGPRHPESFEDPKQVLLGLVRRYGHRTIKANLLPERDSKVKIGLGYNQALSWFVRNSWSVAQAAMCADSLARACRRLRELSLRHSGC
jgi:hypothetical protein